MKYNPKTYERSLTRFIARQALLVQKLIDEAVSQSVLETERFGVKKGEGEDFFFKDYPGLSRKIDGILHSLTGRMDKVVQSGIEWGWELANSKNDDMVWKVINSIGSTRVPYEAPERWMQKNLPALEAFENRRVGGMGLSDRVWNFTSGIKGDLELALDLGLGEGASADRLSREVRGFLREPDRLYRRVRDEKGVLRLSKSASNYHPGQGVYRSSYKNAKRLTATETNMAYRSADYERNQQLDFVLGIEVHLSNNHTCLNAKGEPEPFFDICDELQGRYPADFKFTGWHPQCRCYATTILPSQEEMASYLASMDENGHSDYQFSGRVEDIPPQMKDWLAENEERVLNAKSLPYFIKDNPEISISEAMTEKISSTQAGIEIGDVMRKAREAGPQVQAIAESIAASHGGAVTPINYKSAESIARKCAADHCPPSALKDAVRTTIVVSGESISSAISDLTSRPGFLRWKQQKPEDFLGYSGNIINLRAGNGMVAEIQVLTPKMIYAKNSPSSAKMILGEELWNAIAKETGLPGGLGHKFYEDWRVLERGDKMRDIIEQKSREYYSHFI